MHVGIHRYIYSDGGQLKLWLDLDHSANKESWNRRIIQSQIRVVSPTVVEGYRVITGWAKLRKIYFHLEFSQPILSVSYMMAIGGMRILLSLMVQNCVDYSVSTRSGIMN